MRAFESDERNHRARCAPARWALPILAVVAVLGGPCTVAVASIQEAIASLDPAENDGHRRIHVVGPSADRTAAPGQGQDQSRRSHSVDAGCSYELKAATGATGFGLEPEPADYMAVADVPARVRFPRVRALANPKGNPPAFRHRTSPPTYLVTGRFRD